MPALLFMLVIAPSMVLAFLLNGYSAQAYLAYYFPDPSHWDSGPLWFAIALLLFCFVYVLVRVATARRPQQLALTQGLLVLTAIMLVVSTFVARIFFLLGTGIWNMQLCFFPQYVILFLFGILAYHNGWLEKLDWRMVRPWVYLSVVMSLTLWPALVVLGGAMDGDLSKYMGGIEWQAALLVVWEQLFCVGAVVGLLVVQAVLRPPGKVEQAFLGQRLRRLRLPRPGAGRAGRSLISRCSSPAN